jgi:hypothetical protein
MSQGMAALCRTFISMTGMPSFGKTHTDKQLWGIIAIVKKLPEID